MHYWKEQIDGLGKPEWKQMLEYAVELHIQCTHEATPPFQYPWEEIGTGYCYGPAYSHIDLTHAVMDSIPYQPIHAKQQLLNYLSLQTSEGLIPGCIWLNDGQVKWSTTKGHAPFWPIAVQDFIERYGDKELLKHSYQALERQLDWFEHHRKAEEEGYYYLDILQHIWESGMDDGIRYANIKTGKFACVDATSHVYQMYMYASKWANELELQRDVVKYNQRSDQLAEFFRNALFDQETAMFHDIWSVHNPKQRHLAFECMWPMFVGAATEEQANRVIDENLLNPKRFFTPHPMPTIAIEDPGFELRMWRGASWNSMTYWATRGCMRYGRKDAAAAILERALDYTTKHYSETGTLWEFYHPHGERPEKVQRKPYTEFNQPCREYMGHNPVIAMAKLWEKATSND